MNVSNKSFLFELCLKDFRFDPDENGNVALIY